VSVKTRRYLLCLTWGISGKSSCQSDPRKWPLAWWVGREGGQIFDTGLLLWKLGLGAIWVLIKWNNGRGLEWKTWCRAVNMGLICCSGRTRVLLRNQYLLCWLALWDFNSSILFCL
jgi:hypothetical protein